MPRPLDYHRVSIPCLLILSILLPTLRAYSSQIQFSTDTAKSITNFKTDLAACSCDISNGCDVFCCCDTGCDAGKVVQWTGAGWCLGGATEIEKLCEKVGTKGFSTFEDLGCVMFTNRGAIGSFYDLPDTNNFVDPNTQKFSSRIAKAQSIAQEVQPTISTTTKSYQQNTAIRINNINGNKQLFVWVPSLGQTCRKSYVPIVQGTLSTQCVYSITNQATCQNINKDILGSAFKYCTVGDCSNLSSDLNVGIVVTPTYLANTCSNIVTEIVGTITIDYSNSQYRITTGTLKFTFGSATTQKVYLTTQITIIKAGTSRSGNPGYLFSKPLQYLSGAIYSLTQPNSQNCVLNSSIDTNTKLNIKFGVNETFTCLTTTPCASPLYIDQIPSALSYKLSKYAFPNTEQGPVTAITPNCNAQAYTFYILYSYSGWVMDPQYYIIGSTFSLRNKINPSNMKQLSIKWIKVQPTQISTPPTNYFYIYFQKLWQPLKSTIYGSSTSQSSIYLTVILFMTFLIFL